MRDKQSHSSTAFFTIELMFVLPIVFFIIIVVLDYNFYCYDRSKIQADLYETLQQLISDDNITKNNIIDRISNDLYISRLMDVTVDNTEEKVSLSGTYKMSFPGLFLPIWGEDGFLIIFHKELPRINREEKNRRYFTAIEAGMKIKGVKNITEQVRSLIQKIH